MVTCKLEEPGSWRQRLRIGILAHCPFVFQRERSYTILKAGPPALSLTLLPGTRRGVGFGGRRGDGVVVEI